MRTRWIRSMLSSRRGLLAGCVFLLSPSVIAAVTLLDFENLPPGTTVTSQYAEQGVIFSSAFLASDPAARSGTRVLRTINPAAEVFTPIAFKMTFVRPPARVKLFTASPGTARNATLSAFDANGSVIAQDGPKPVAADRFTTMFEVVAPAAGIIRAELQLEGAAHYAIDDLEFDDTGSSTEPRVTEMRQPAATDNAAVSGKFPSQFDIGRRPEFRGAESAQPEGEAEERFDIQFAPTVERDLARGATAQLVMRVPARAGLAGTARWIGTSAALRVGLSLNGTSLASGQNYGLGANRGGSNVSAVAKTGGEAALTLRNTSNVPVKVRLSLGFVPGRGER
jgi:hypothetical protein